MWKLCWSKGRLYWKIAKLFHFCHLSKLVRPETYGPYHVKQGLTQCILSSLGYDVVQSDRWPSAFRSNTLPPSSEYPVLILAAATNWNRIARVNGQPSNSSTSRSDAHTAQRTFLHWDWQFCRCLRSNTSLLRTPTIRQRNYYYYYRGADKSFLRPGRKQAREHVRDARNLNKIETRAVSFPARQGAEGNSRHSDRNISLFPSWPG